MSPHLSPQPSPYAAVLAEFASPGQPDRVLNAGEVLILPAGAQCRAYRWPRDASEATVFVATYPTGQNRAAAGHAG